MQIANEGRENTLFIIGDSHANFILYRFKQLWLESKANKTLDTFPTIVSMIQHGNPYTPRAEIFKFSINYIKKHKPKRILFANNWGYTLDSYVKRFHPTNKPTKKHK